jgi:hypothetical protein
VGKQTVKHSGVDPDDPSPLLVEQVQTLALFPSECSLALSNPHSLTHSEMQMLPLISKFLFLMALAHEASLAALLAQQVQFWLVSELAAGI